MPHLNLIKAEYVDTDITRYARLHKRSGDTVYNFPLSAVDSAHNQTVFYRYINIFVLCICSQRVVIGEMVQAVVRGAQQGYLKVTDIAA